MARIERLWKDVEIRGMDETVTRLRRMRTAIFQEETIGLRLRRKILKVFGKQEPIHSHQDALLHAEQLANAAGDFFAAKISRTMHGTKEFERWQDLLSDAKRQYSVYGISTWARSSLRDVVGNSIIGRLRCLHIDPDFTLAWDLTHNNKFGVRSVQELLRRNDLGIFSPLSGDYLMATMYSSYLRRLKGKTFPVRAVALHEDLSQALFPTDADGHLPFQEKKEIGVYIDTIDTGSTSLALEQFLQKAYPQKIIHPPATASTEFEQSKKMKWFWKST
ncbi:hypothetical protein HY213_00300 [Candidatus Peregrinibacteria bacterium]|nr:hypothetical protein [Candidatus Peregrinibacteria bacterium]